MAAFQELIKDFNKIRYYARDFFIYGYRSRGEHGVKSARSYDNEKRRLESFLPEMIHTGMGPRGKRVSMRVRANQVTSNPLHALWDTRALTRNDYLLNLLIPDLLLTTPDQSAGEIADRLALEYGEAFQGARLPDGMTVRNKLLELEACGRVSARKEGKTLRYRWLPALAEECSPELQEALGPLLAYGSNTAPLSILGRRLLRRFRAAALSGECPETAQAEELFRFRHYYLFHTLDDEILLALLPCIDEGRSVAFNTRSRRRETCVLKRGIPVRILTSARHGRRFVLVYDDGKRAWFTIRLDKIESIAPTDTTDDPQRLLSECAGRFSGSWGISTPSATECETLRVRLFVDERFEAFILHRLQREGKQGTVTRVAENLFDYEVALLDTTEAIPWLRTFIGRIVEIEGSNAPLLRRFKADLEAMYQLYDIPQEGDPSGSVQ